MKDCLLVRFKMELATAPSPIAPGVVCAPQGPRRSLRLRYVYVDDNHHQKNNSSSCSSTPKYPLQVQPLLRQPKLNLHIPNYDVSDSSGISSQPLKPLHPQTASSPTTSWRKKKKEKGVNPVRGTTSDILRLMDGLGFSVPIEIYTDFLEECTVSGDPKTAMELHTHITQRGVKPPLPLLNRVLVMLVSCGLLERARHLFDVMFVRDFNSWATLIVAYYEDGNYEEVINLFFSMLSQVSMLKLPAWFMVCLLKACDCSMNFSLGKQVHGWLLKLGICNDVLVSSCLISFYGKSMCLEDANIAFNQVSRHNSLTWTAKIVNDCKVKHFREVLSDFKEMGRQGIKKNSITFSNVLKACGRLLVDGHCGQQVHADAIKLGLATDTYVQRSLIDMYGRNGLVREAKQVFRMIHDKTSTAYWNAMLMAYIHGGSYIEAIKFLYQMKAAGMQPQESLLNEVRIACGSNTCWGMN